MLQRPGEAFGAPISLGRFGAYPREFSLAADGTGAAAWNSGNWRRPRLVVRVLGIDGTWHPPSRVPGSDLQIVAAPGGQVLLPGRPRQAGETRSTSAWWHSRCPSGLVYKSHKKTRHTYPACPM